MEPYSELKTFAEIAQSFLSIVAILIGGGWTFWRFILQRERHPKIQFNVDLKVIGMQDNKLVVEIVAIVENKGLVRHRINDFKFDLLYLSKGNAVIEGDERINRQVLFEKAISKRYWIPPDWHHSFIDPGITQLYTYLTWLPADAAFASVYANFKYPESKGDFHTAQKTFNLI